MSKLTGKGVYGGVAVGEALFFHRTAVCAQKRTVENTEEEIARFLGAKRIAKEELERLYEQALRDIGESGASIFEIHGMMLEDEDYSQSIENTIRMERANAEYAVMLAADHFAAVFSGMNDPYMSARAADVRDISGRLCRILSGNGEEGALSEHSDVILCADDLAPSETMQLDRTRIAAFVTAEGSVNSHTAILARTMGIPAIVGVGRELLELADGAILGVDSFEGVVYVSPDEEKQRELRQKREENERAKELLQAYRGLDNVTVDGHRIDIFANVQSIFEVGAARWNDAGGIGLFRSEFLYLDRNDYPTEEEQFGAYRTVLQSMGDKKVVIRTLDIGADKQAAYFGLEQEENPALGLRAIRICLCRPEVFRTQLRALLRASVFGNLAIMFPMITSVSELSEILTLYERTKKELIEEGETISDRIEVGIMIETPAAALISERLAPLVDFFSIGTNDLTQYTLAMDRQNRNLHRFFDEHHEAVLRLIDMTVKNAHRHGKWVGICGELGADLSLTECFLRMGVDELSVSPSYILSLREHIRTMDLRKEDSPECGGRGGKNE